MLKIDYTNLFKKDYKRIIKRGYNPKLFTEVVNMLANQQPLPTKYRDHALIGDYIGYRECHITPDWLLVYKIQDDKLILLLARTGSHSDLF